MSNTKKVLYEGLEIVGDANTIDRVIYGLDAQKNIIEGYKSIEEVMGDIYAFNSKFIEENLTDDEKCRWAKQFILCIEDELSELLGELPWKHWKDYTGETLNYENIKGELADILIFTFGIAGIMGIEPLEMIQAIADKNNVNFERQRKGY